MPETVFKGLVTRDKKVAFMEVLNGSEAGQGTYTRMSKFTDMGKSSNPNEYSRKYVDESGEETDVTGYSPSISYTFDQYTDNAVHSEIIDITDNEKVGDAAVRNIIIIDFTSPVTGQDGQYNAKKRAYSVVPDADGDDANTYTYSGTFRSKGSAEDVVVTVSADGQTCTIVTQSEE